MDPFLPDDSKLAALRELLPSLGSGIRLDVTSAGPFPSETDRAIHQLAEHELRVGRSGRDRDEEAAQRAVEAGSVLAAVLSTTPELVVLAPGTRAALSAVVHARGRMPGGTIAWMGELRGQLEVAVEAVATAHRTPLVRAANEIPTDAGLLLVSHVDPVTGQIADPRPAAERAHQAGAGLVLDAAWSAGAVPIDAPSTGADILVVDTHRWLLGPEGVTALWFRDPIAARRARDIIDPLSPALLLAVARSIGWLLMYVSLPWAFERTEALATRLHHALVSIHGVRIGAPARGIAAALPFAIAGWSAGEAAAELARRAHAVIDVDPVRDLLVASVGSWLREEEVDRFAAAVGEIAAHTPATLPRRPLLTVLAPEASGGR